LNQEFLATLSTNPNTPEVRTPQSNKSKGQNKNKSPINPRMNFSKDKSHIAKPKKK